jgi:hypothetical protein
MAKRKKKITLDKEAAEEKKRHGRVPTARPTEFHKDKSKYTRKEKHKNAERN